MVLEKIERENYNPEKSTLAKGIFKVDGKEYKISIGETRYQDCHWIDVTDIIDGQEGGTVGSWDNSIYKEVKCCS